MVVLGDEAAGAALREAGCTRSAASAAHFPSPVSGTFGGHLLGVNHSGTEVFWAVRSGFQLRVHSFW